jgi:hypothetical protein
MISVVKLHSYSCAKDFPELFITHGLTIAVYIVFATKTAVGEKAADLPVLTTFPDTSVVPVESLPNKKNKPL